MLDSRTFYKLVAEKTGHSEQVVKDVVEHFYYSLREKLSKLVAVDILVHGLGSFSLRENRTKKMNNSIKKIIKNRKELGRPVDDLELKSNRLEERISEIYEQKERRKRYIGQLKGGESDQETP